MAERKRFQIGLRTLILSTSFVGAGVGYLLAALQIQHKWALWQRMFAPVQYPVGGPLIGAGLFMRFRHVRWGAYTGSSFGNRRRSRLAGPAAL
jgi:hypothetical protein